MRIHSLNNTMPNVKQGEDQSNIIEIAVPQDMQSYSLFLFFSLPDGTTVFTSRVEMVNGKISYPLNSALTSAVGRVTVELQGTLDDRLIKSINFAYNVIASVSNTPGPAPQEFAPWYLEVMERSDDVMEAAEDLDARLDALKIAEPQRQINEQARILNEDERKANEITRQNNEVIRQTVYESKANQSTTYTKTEVDTKDALLVPKTTTVNTKALSGNISITAADVPNTPAGTIAATTVQTALNELDTEKVPKTTTVNTKALSGNISVTAADIPNTPAGTIAGATVQAALNELDTKKAQTGLPCVIARNSVAQSTTFNNTTILNFDTNVYINDATMRDTDQTKVTIRKAGIYLIVAQLELTANATGMRTFTIKKNGSIDLVRETHPSEIAGAASRMQIQTVALLAVADYITVGMYHNAGVNLNTITGDHSPVLSICMLEAI